jgi:hypothetical protein
MDEREWRKRLGEAKTEEELQDLLRHKPKGAKALTSGGYRDEEEMNMSSNPKLERLLNGEKE